MPDVYPTNSVAAAESFFFLIYTSRRDLRGTLSLRPDHREHLIASDVARRSARSTRGIDYTSIMSRENAVEFCPVVGESELGAMIHVLFRLVY